MSLHMAFTLNVLFRKLATGLFVKLQQDNAQQEYCSWEVEQFLQLKKDIVALFDHFLHTSHL